MTVFTDKEAKALNIGDILVRDQTKFLKVGEDVFVPYITCISELDTICNNQTVH